MKSTSSLQPIAQESLNQTIISRLTQFVWDDLHEGERLPSEKELAEQLRVGRSSLREALRALVATGLVEVRRGSGYFVTKSAGSQLRAPMEFGLFRERQSIAEVIEARSVIELAMVDLIVDRISDEEVNLAADALEEMKKSGSDVNRLLAADVRFHQILYRSTHNSVVYHVSDLVRQIVGQVPDDYLRSESDLQESYSYHAAILNAVRMRNRKRLANAVRAHSEWIIRVFDVAGE